MLLACLSPAGWAQKDKPKKETPAQRAGRLYTTAVSAMRARQWEQARGALEEYLSSSGTHEYAAVATLQLAHCRYQLADYTGYEAALDQAIKKFPGAPAWQNAYGARLGRAKRLKDPELYLKLLEAMLRQTKEAPWDLSAATAWQYSTYWNSYYYHYRSHRWHFWPRAFTPGRTAAKPGWVLDVVGMADSPERAQQALRILAKNFSQLSKDMPPDWQHAHAALLRRAGQAEQAEQAWKGYLDAWGDDPRAIDLWMLRIQDAAARKDRRAVDAAYQQLLSRYAGAETLAGPLYQHLARLVSRREHEEFTRLARKFLETYTTTRWWSAAVSLWVTSAKREAAKGNKAVLAPTLKMIEEVHDAHFPHKANTSRHWRIDLHMLLGQHDRAARVAAEVITEPNWSAQAYNQILRYANTHEVFLPLAAAARKKWNIPVTNPTSKAFVLLNELRGRLKDEQVRHAEEIGEEMFGKHRDDASTIEGVKLLADYYFKKVLAAPRDKWMTRMIQTYPRHPLTQAVLVNRITADQAERQYGRLALALDTMAKRFPGAASRWYALRIQCYNLADDPAGALTYVQKVHGQGAEAGDLHCLQQVARYELAGRAGEFKAIGDYWMARAGKLAGKRAELYCLAQAWSAYYVSPYYQGRPTLVCWNEARSVAKRLRSQTLNPEAAWGMAFADVNLSAHEGQGQAALKSLNELLADERTYRDLSQRLDLPRLGAALGNANLLKEGEALAAKLRKCCFTRPDTAAIEVMLGAMCAARKSYPQAARHYLAAVETSPWTAQMYPFFSTALTYLQYAKAGKKYAAEMEAYLRKVDRVPELVPPLLYRAAVYYVGARSSAALKMRKRLTSSYPASMARDKLAEYFDRLRKQQARN